MTASEAACRAWDPELDEWIELGSVVRGQNGHISGHLINRYSCGQATNLRLLAAALFCDEIVRKNPLQVCWKFALLAQISREWIVDMRVQSGRKIMDLSGGLVLGH